MTILHARAAIGLLAPRWNRLVWTIVSAVGRIASRHRATVLSFAGPLIVVSLIVFRALGLGYPIDEIEGRRSTPPTLT